MIIKEMPIKEKADRIDLIVNNAKILIKSRGIESFTIDELSKKIEMSRGTIYYYFKSKNEIFLKIVTEENLKLAGVLNNIPGNINSLKWLEDLLNSAYEFNKNDPILLDILIYLNKNINIPEKIKNKILYEEYLNSLYASSNPVNMAIKKGQEENQIKNDLLHLELAFTIMSPLLTFLNLVSNSNYLISLKEIYHLNGEKIYKNFLKLIIDAIKK